MLEQAQSSMDTEGPTEYGDLTNNNHLPDSTNFYRNESTSGEWRKRERLSRVLVLPLYCSAETCTSQLARSWKSRDVWL